jgi:uncharacterized membrane protein YqaE (UPF0057 family)
MAVEFDREKEIRRMGLGRAIVCVLLPPLAVIDKGCGPLLLVTLLTLIGWVPGVIGALVVCMGSTTEASSGR